MFFRVMMFVWEFVLELVAVMRMTDDEKENVDRLQEEGLNSKKIAG